MSLPIKAIDRLFERLAATYGNDWTRQWASVPIADVKSVWAHELSGFAGKLQCIAWALENLPEQCPNVIQFKHLCRKAPDSVLPQLAAPEPKADPARVAAELAKLRGTLGIPAPGAPTNQVNHRAWAPRILARLEAGEKISPTVVKMARDCVALSH